MRAGELRHLIDFEAATETQNEYGEPVKTWAQVGHMWAKKEDLSGRELFQAQQVHAGITTQFTVRYTDALNPEMRISYGGQFYDIKSIGDPDGRNQKLEIVCERKAGE